MVPRKRRHDPTIPAHIDQAGIPTGVYWDRSGKGRWYVLEREEGKPKRHTIAGPKARLSDLHALVEGSAGVGTVEWLAAEYRASAKFAKLAAGTQKDYDYSRDVLLAFPSPLGVPFGKLEANRLRNTHLQAVVDALEKQGTPTKANKVLRYARLLFRWGLNRGKVRQNPAQGLEAATERKRQRLPAPEVYAAMLAYAQGGAALKARTRGSCSPYLPLVMEVSYLCRLRGIETITLTEAQADSEGLLTNRRKRSRDNFVEWNSRLRAAWDAALALRRSVMERTRRPEMLKPQDRVVFLEEGGEPLSRSTLDSAWQRLIWNAIEAGVISEDQRFSLHDLKRKGGTDTPGTRAEKQDALGVSEAMMKVYDKSVPRVKPSAGFTE